MSASHPAVHPVEAPPATDANDVPRVRMKDTQGMPGTVGGLALRLLQFAFAVGALCVMVSTSDFSSVTAFRYAASFPSSKLFRFSLFPFLLYFSSPFSAIRCFLLELRPSRYDIFPDGLPWKLRSEQTDEEVEKRGLIKASFCFQHYELISLKGYRNMKYL